MKQKQQWDGLMLRLQIFRGIILFWIVAVWWYALFFNEAPYQITTQSAEWEHCGIVFDDYETYQDAVALDINCRITLWESEFANIDPSRLDDSLEEPGEGVLVEYDKALEEKIVEWKIVVRADDDEIAEQVKEKLLSEFGESIIEIKKLFPDTSLLSDLIVEYKASDKSYTDITDYLSSVVEFEWVDDTTGEEKKLVRVNPNVAFEHKENKALDEQSREDSLIAVPNPNWFGVQSVEVDLTQWYLEHIGHQEVLECLPEWRPIKIAVVDNGFDLEHPDLKGKILKTYDEADKDENAQVPNYKKERNHGTKEAGIIWAEHNDIWIDWVFPHAELILVKSTRDDANGRDVTNGIEAIAKAYELWAEVINLSRWWYGDVPMLERITKKVASKGVKLIAAAWNYNKEEKFYPAAYDRVIWVSAIDQNNKKAKFSNYWSRVDIAAPGVNMVTTDLDNTYNPYNGTSEASPVVAWSIALAMSHGLDRKDISRNTQDIWNEALWVGMIDLRFMCEEFEEKISETDMQLASHASPPKDVFTSRLLIFVLSALCILFSLVTGMIDMIRRPVITREGKA